MTTLSFNRYNVENGCLHFRIEDRNYAYKGKAVLFDAVSAKRFYRDAMPLHECYKIIINGRCVDFDPDIVDAFMMDQDKVEEIYYNSGFRER